MEEIIIEFNDQRVTVGLNVNTEKTDIMFNNVPPTRGLTLVHVLNYIVKTI